MPPGSSPLYPNPLADPDLTGPTRDSTTPDDRPDPGSAPRDRDAFLSALFRETDRAQRMKTALSLIVFAVHDANDSSAPLPADTYREVLCQIIQRTVCTLRSYDLTGEIGNGHLAVALPGCNTFSAVTLAERLRSRIADSPFRLHASEVPLSACFGIAAGNGRSALVVLRDAEGALNRAKLQGPGSILSSGSTSHAGTSLAGCLSHDTWDEPIS